MENMLGKKIYILVVSDVLNLVPNKDDNEYMVNYFHVLKSIFTANVRGNCDILVLARTYGPDICHV